jgi:hypothetical protein
MRAVRPVLALVACATLLLISAAAGGNDGMTIVINNNTARDVTVTVYDMNTNPVRAAVTAQTINSFASISVIVTPDASGLGHVSWTATTVGKDMRMCGRNDKPQLSDGDTVHVYANGECGHS